MTDGLGCVGTVARFKPVHNAHAAMLEEICGRASHVVIGIGSSNRYDVTNPFTAQETREMLDAMLQPRFTNYTVIDVPDLWDGPKWRIQARELYGPLDHFIVANEYVTSLLKDDYRVVHPVTLIPESKQTPITGTMVRLAMARGEPWEQLVPPAVAAYMTGKGLPERFVREFGLATLAHAADEAITGTEQRGL